MFFLLPTLTLAQVNPAAIAPDQPEPVPQIYVQPQQVRPLLGSLDDTPVFNSNSPELVQTPGILLSTFPPDGMTDPSAHLNWPLTGRFDIFAHHVAKAPTPDDLRSLYLGILIHNPGSQPVTLDILTAASYLSQPDAPFITLPSQVDNPNGSIYAGPGSRVMSDILRGRRQSDFPAQLIIPPGESRMVLNAPIPVRELDPPLNGRSTLLQVRSSAPVYVASLAQYAPLAFPELEDLQDERFQDEQEISPLENEATKRSRYWPDEDNGADSDDADDADDADTDSPESDDDSNTDSDDEQPIVNERAPTLAEWEALLTQSGLAGPRDRTPTPPNQSGQIIYGRVAGVAQGARWETVLADLPSGRSLRIPNPGESYSYGISLLRGGELGTHQVQSAPMLVRYADTAYEHHGNYGVEYSLSLPLHNPTAQTQTVELFWQTPLKESALSTAGLQFYEEPPARTFFRGTVSLRYTDAQGNPRTLYTHLVQQRGESGTRLLKLKLPAETYTTVQVNLLYPPDATPPQVLTLSTRQES